MFKTKWKTVLLGLALVGGLWKAHHMGYTSAEQTYQLIAAEKAAKDADNALKREQKWQQVYQEQEHKFLLGMRGIADDRADFDRIAGGLQKQLADTDRRIRNAATTPGINAGAAEAALVLSKLLDEATAELGRVAETADGWHEQAVGCNRYYDAMRGR